MSTTRRGALKQAAAVTLGFAGLRTFVHGTPALAAAPMPYGKLVSDPNGMIDLPEGFSYRVISRWGETMDDGLLVPGMHDGMAAFPGPNGKTILVRNHELGFGPARYGAFGWSGELRSKIDRRKFYDPGRAGMPVMGGTTTIVYDTRKQTVEKHFLSLAGTGRNCAGGPTPWHSWITCEEWTQKPDAMCARDHGYNFEVPAVSECTLAEPVPLKAMGRFNHEAVAVDPDSGAVYQTEDRGDSCIYRYLPNQPGRLAAGGRLQALVVRDRRSLDTRNWVDAGGNPIGNEPVSVGQAFDVDWIDLDDPESPNDDLRHRAYAAGAARFTRGEGMWHSRDGIYFACTSGGPKRLGQIWRYVPSRFEGRPDEKSHPGRLELFIEPDDGELIENADNLTVSPWGDLFVCEDGPGENRLMSVKPDGTVGLFARNYNGQGELAGVTVSPDGSTLFVNIQQLGATLAITGPFPRA